MDDKEQKAADKKAVNKFLDKVIIHMLISVTAFTVIWTIMNAFGLQVQSEVIIGWFAFWGAEGGISGIIQIKKNKKAHSNPYDMGFGGYDYPRESYNEPSDDEPSDDETEIK